MAKRQVLTICGLDEAGRGALAGPLVAAAIILKKEVENIRDGKLLTPKQRRRIYSRLKKSGAEIFVEIISARQINNHGIGWANKEIFRKLIQKIPADKYIIDGKLKIKVRGKTKLIQSVIDADATIPEVILAGIVAKVERDAIMRALDWEFPKYNWRVNKGYGTRNHIVLILEYGICHLHRTVFTTTAMAHAAIKIKVKAPSRFDFQPLT